jgi:hypothetical protein
MSEIKAELGSSSNSLRAYSAATGKSAPDAMSEFYANCECYSVLNESGDRSIIFQYNRCSDGSVASLSVADGAVATVCVSPGGDVYDTSGLLTVVACGTSCSTNGDCADCI